MNKKDNLLFLIAMYTEELIQELIKCPKRIIDTPKDSGINRGSYKKIFTLSSLDGQYSFSGFISQNTFFQENFSIGLVFHPKDEKGKICLLRCNGLHGEVIGVPHHSFCHIHTAKAEDINAGIKVERNIEETHEYSTLSDAIQFYVKYVNIVPVDRQKYFQPPSGQMELGL